MKLLTEVSFDEVKILTEGAEGEKKSTYIVGPMIAANIKNRNGRWYPSDIVEKEVARYTVDYINKNRSLGELQHPPTPQISYERASHLVKELKRDGDCWIGKAKILEGIPMGKLAKGLIDEGISIGVSTRGLGSLREDSKLGAKVVGDDFRLCAVDLVSDPSGPNCFVQGLMEGAEWVWDASSEQYVQRALEEIKEVILEAPKVDLTEATTKAFTKFFQLLKEKTR